jgi:hypothetical protein
MNNEFLELYKRDYNYKHENDRISIDDDACFVALGCEYANQEKFSKDGIERKIIDDFTWWLEQYFKTCAGNGK